MIAQLHGILIEKTPPFVVLDCHGVGYECELPMSSYYPLPALGEPVKLLIHMVVREDAHLLYGFTTSQERATFRQLLKVSGIGAKSALAILSGLSVQELAQCIALQELGMLVKIPGIGKKTAERLLLELKDKMGLEPGAQVANGLTSGSDSNPQSDILNALLALGYHERDALGAIKRLPAGLGITDSIRQALKLLSN